MTAGDTQLGIGTVEVRGDGAGRQEQAVGNLAVRQAVPGENGYLALLSGEPVQRARLEPRIRERAQAVRTRALDDVARQAFEFVACQSVAETVGGRKEGQGHFGLGFAAELNLRLLG